VYYSYFFSFCSNGGKDDLVLGEKEDTDLFLLFSQDSFYSISSDGFFLGVLVDYWIGLLRWCFFRVSY